MKYNKKVTKYSTGSKFFHWLIFIIVTLMLSGSFFLDDLPNSYQGTAFMIHKSFGLTILFLMLARMLWIIHSGKPSLPATVSRCDKILSRIVQYSLYLFLIAQSLSGWIMSVAANKVPSFFGLYNVPLPIQPNKILAGFMDNTHKLIPWILIGLIVLHIAGALKHHFIDKDNVLKSMLS